MKQKLAKAIWQQFTLHLPSFGIIATLSLVVLTGIFPTSWLRSQQIVNPSTVSPYFSTQIPPPPDVAALGKFGDIPVGLHTGVPNISIPIYELKSRDITVPISINYHAGGIKVDEIASSVGLGWALNAGGVISAPRKAFEFFYGANPFIQEVQVKLGQLIRPESGRIVGNISVEWSPNYYFFQQVLNGDLATEIPTFSYSYLGKSGKFVLAPNAGLNVNSPPFRYKPIPFEPIEIVSTNANPTNGITISDEFGFKYYFTAKGEETSHVTSISGLTINDIDCMLQNNGNNMQNDNVTLYLTKITSAIGDSVTFEYESVGYGYQTFSQETKFVEYPNLNFARPNDVRCFRDVGVTELRTKKIRSSSGTEVNFEYDQIGREDLGLQHITNGQVSSRLTAIKIIDEGKVIKTFVFAHEYFVSTVANPPAWIDASYKKRLKLVSLTEAGKAPYQFSYNSNNLPYRFSFSQDHWGFNNAKNNSTLIPAFRNNGLIVPGADREVDTVAAQAFLLTNMIYPTGGQTEFKYESHDQYTIDSTVVTDVFTACSGGNWGTSTPTCFENNSFRIDANLNKGVEVFTTFYNAPGAYFSNLSARLEGPAEEPNPYLRISYAFYPPATNSHGERVYFNRLRPGTYYLTAISDGINDGSQMAGITVNVERVTYFSANKKIGGVRIKSITDKSTDGGTNKVREYSYRKPGTNVSSAVCIKEPVYLTSYNKMTQMGSYPDFFIRKDSCIQATATTLAPLATTQGSFVSYEYATETFGSASESGKRDLRFLCKCDLSSSINRKYSTDNSYEWARGHIASEVFYRKEGNVFHLVKKTENSYDFNHEFYTFNRPLKPNEFRVRGAFVRQKTPPLQLSLQPSSETLLGEISVDYYDITSAWYYLKQRKNYFYQSDDTTKYLLNTETFYYDRPDHAQLTKTVYDTNSGSSLEIRTKYPTDYLNGAAAWIDNLVSSRQIAVPIESQSWMSKGGTTSFKNGVLFTFRNEIGKIVKDKTYVLNPINPVTDFIEITQNGKFAQAIPDSRYSSEVKFLTYDNVGNVTSYEDKVGKKTFITYDYNKRYVTSEVKGCIGFGYYAFSSFESSNLGGWIYTGSAIGTDYKTGRKCYNLATSAITKASLPTARYVLSYWAKGATQPSVTGGTTVLTTVAQGSTTSGTWYQVVKTINVTSANTTLTISGTGLIDELRLHPLEAKMTTYTYDPSVGVTTITDEKGQTRYFEYDAFGRLKAVRDEAGNLLSTQEYKYKN